MCYICKKTHCDSRCPNYESHSFHHYCNICNGEINEGDDYIENMDGEYIHYECIQGIRQLLDWLGYDIKTMEDCYER